MKRIPLRRQVFALIWTVAVLGGGGVEAETPRGIVFAGPGAGGAPECLFHTLNAAPQLPWTVFSPTDSNGVYVATGDVNGDGQAEIICGSAGGPHVRVLNGQTRQVLFSFTVLDPAFARGVAVATGDFTGDGAAEIVVGAGAGGGPHVKILSANGQTEIASFNAFVETFLGGVRVAVGDVTGDGKPDVIVGAGPGGGPHVKVFDGVTRTEVATFMAFDPTFNGGVFPAVGKFDADAKMDIVVGPGPSTPGPGPPVPQPAVTVFSGATLAKLGGLLPFPVDCRAGARVAVGDFTKDGFDDIVVGPPGAGCGMDLAFFDGRTLVPLFALALHPEVAERGGFLAIGNVDRDATLEVILGGGAGGPPTLTSFEPEFRMRHSKAPHASTFRGGVPVAMSDIDGDGIPDEFMGCGNGAGSVSVCRGPDGASVGQFFPFGTAHTGGVSVAGGDINGDDTAELIVATFSGPTQVRVLHPITGAQLAAFFPFGAGATGGASVAGGDVNGDGIDDIVVGAGPGGGRVMVFNPNGLGVLRDFQPYGAASISGVHVATGDLNGDGRAEIVTGLGTGGGAHVKVFDGATGAEVMSFFAYDLGFTGGVRVAVGDVNGDSRPDLITGPGVGMAPQVRFFDGRTLRWLGSYSPFPESFTGGVYVGSATLPRPSITLADFKRGPTGKVTFMLLGPKGRDVELQVSADGFEWTQIESRAATGLPQAFEFTAPTTPDFFLRGASK